MKTHLVFTLILIAGIGGIAGFDFKFGFDMVVRAYDAVCWFEALKQFPNTKVEMFNQCGGSAQYTVDYNGDNVLNVNSDDTIESLKVFADAFAEFPMARIPKEYAGNCTQYLWDPLEPPPANESHALNDGDIDYPYKAFTHCMMNQLRTIHGEFAINAVVKERTHGTKDWITTFFDRFNEFRALHKSAAVSVVNELNVQAQKWADKMASECKITASASVERQYKGKECGENLVSVWTGMLDEMSTAAYAAAATWYEEIKHYPWETGFKDDDVKKVDWNLFGKIKDFTQLIWGNSRMVGYGYAYNASCAGLGMESRFMVARYYPAGNTLGVKGEFKANVQPATLLGAVLNVVPSLLGALLG